MKFYLLKLFKLYIIKSRVQKNYFDIEKIYINIIMQKINWMLSWKLSAQ